uniref:Ig-like domain-containing protein n=1 Tax=Sinocyclocheilus anshuiensis TaxID=1608454 RepID=A0A671MAH8_9TELE
MSPQGYIVLRCWFVVGVVSYISVTGYSGGKVIITCKYERKYTENAKYFCKGQKPVTPQIGWCSDLIKTEEKNEWVDSGRFSLFDDTRAAVFTVTIRDLSEEDSGTHQCGVDIRISEDFYTEVNLNIITDSYTEVNLKVLTGDTPARFPRLRVLKRLISAAAPPDYNVHGEPNTEAAVCGAIA